MYMYVACVHQEIKPHSMGTYSPLCWYWNKIHFIVEMTSLNFNKLIDDLSSLESFISGHDINFVYDFDKEPAPIVIDCPKNYIMFLAILLALSEYRYMVRKFVLICMLNWSAICVLSLICKSVKVFVKLKIHSFVHILRIHSFVHVLSQSFREGLSVISVSAIRFHSYHFYWYMLQVFCVYFEKIIKTNK